MSSKLISEVTERRCSKKRWASFFLIHFVYSFFVWGDFFVMSKLFEKKRRRKNLSLRRAEKSCAFLHKNNNVEKTARTKREHKPGVGAHRSGRGYFESELNVRTVQEYTQRGEHGGMFFILVFVFVF